MVRKIKSFGGAGLLIAATALLLAGCGGNASLKEIDTPTYGKIKIAFDDSYRLMTEAEIYAFETFYTHAKIDTVYGNEADVISEFMKDSVPLMVINRKLTKEEETWLNARQVIPKTTRVASDAIAFIVNRDNPDSNFFYDKIADIFKGKVTSWKQINPKSTLGDLKIVFDNYKSGNTRYFREKFGVDKLPGTCFAVSGNDEVINFVEKNKSSIGVVSVNWISDSQDTVTRGFLKKIRVAGISAEGNNDPDAAFYQPYQYHMAQNFYPFTRDVYFVNRQTYSGLAYGFTSFVAGPQGQLIILHSGLVPATMPVRIVEVKH